MLLCLESEWMGEKGIGYCNMNAYFGSEGKDRIEHSQEINLQKETKQTTSIQP